MQAKSQKEKSCCLVLRGNNPLFKKTEHKDISLARTNDKRNTSREFSSQKMTKSNCSSCGNKAKSSCGCLPCHLEREEKEAFPYLPKEIAEELKREHEYLKNTGYNEDDFREHLEKEEYLFEEYLPKHLQEKMEQEHSQLAPHSNSYNKDGLENWPAAKLNQKLRECVHTLLEQYLKKCGIKTEILNQINTKMTYGLAGTSYAGGHEEVSTAAILYPNVGNQVFENGDWTELEQMRIILSKPIIDDLLQKKYFENSNKKNLNSSTVSLIHELIHAFIYKTVCPGQNISFYENSANEDLTQVLVNLLLAKIELFELEQEYGSQKFSERQLASEIEKAKQHLKNSVAIVENKGGAKCLGFFLSDSNESYLDNSGIEPSLNRLIKAPLHDSSLRKPAIDPMVKKTIYPLKSARELQAQKFPFSYEEEIIEEELDEDFDKNDKDEEIFLEDEIEDVSLEDEIEGLNDESLGMAFKRLLEEMNKWDVKTKYLAEIVNAPNTVFIENELDEEEEKANPFLFEGAFYYIGLKEGELQYQFYLPPRFVKALKENRFYEGKKLSEAATVATYLLVEAVVDTECACEAKTEEPEVYFNSVITKFCAGVIVYKAELFKASKEEEPKLLSYLNLSITLATTTPAGSACVDKLFNFQREEGSVFPGSQQLSQV